MCIILFGYGTSMLAFFAGFLFLSQAILLWLLACGFDHADHETGPCGNSALALPLLHTDARWLALYFASFPKAIRMSALLAYGGS